LFGVFCFLFGVWCLRFGVWCLLFGVFCLGLDFDEIGDEEVFGVDDAAGPGHADAEAGEK